MLQAILSDIHSNLEALRAVLEAADSAGADDIVCLGDVVGYGADPVEVIALVRERASAAVIGNHDVAAIERGAEDGMNEWARAAAVWTREQLDADAVEFLSALTLTATAGNALLVHASPTAPADWEYLTTERGASVAFRSFDEPICFVGHTHVPDVFEEVDGLARVAEKAEGSLLPERRYVVNVGSVGQPRDGDPRACFALFDPSERELRLVRVAYDVEAARNKIVAAGLPVQLGDRLLEGY